MEKANKRRGPLVFLLLIGLVLGGFLAFRFYQKREPRGGSRGGGAGQRAGVPGAPAGPAMRAQPVEVAAVERGTLHEVVSLVGSLKPKERVEVTSKITGRVERVYVDVGDRVEEGRLIAELEGEELEQQVLRAEASLAVAQAMQAQRGAELENARAEEQRSAELRTQGLISLQAHQTAETRALVVDSQLRLAGAQVRQAQAELEELRIRLQQAKIHSPLSGWVARRYVHPGALVNPNTPILSLLRLSTMVVEVNVPERDLVRLRAGSQAVVTIDALGDRNYDGRVARISPLLDPATRSGSVEIEIPNPKGELKAEMFARIQMDLGTERDVLLVPREAVVLRGQQAGVNVLVTDRVQFHPIQTGASTGQGVEVVAGLAEGTTVVTRGTQVLKDGDAVMVQERQAGPGDLGGQS